MPSPGSSTVHRPVSSLVAEPVNPPGPLTSTFTPSYATRSPFLSWNRKPNTDSPSAAAGPAPMPRTTTRAEINVASNSASLLRTRHLRVGDERSAHRWPGA